MLWLLETIFFLSFSDILATDSFIFSSSENIFLNDSFAASRNGFCDLWKPFFFYLFFRYFCPLPLEAVFPSRGNTF